MQYARSKQVVTFAAAGNSFQSGNQPSYPAAYPEAIAVAAIDSSRNHASFSNTGAYVDLAAPGDSIWSTYGQGRSQYALMSGTSMATPYATATAALVLGENPKLSAADLSQLLESSATDLGSPGRDDTYGYGLINPRRVVGGIAEQDRPRCRWSRLLDRDARRTRARIRQRAVLRRLERLLRSPRRSSPPRVHPTAGDTGSPVRTARCTHSVTRSTAADSTGRHLNSPIVAMAAMPNGMGYILLGRDGGVFAFGNARFYGSTGGWRLNAPVLDVTMTADGRGYWFVAADGGVFSFGDARFHGSTGSMKLSQPVRSMTAAANGTGYWMVADDGGIFAFNVPFEGSLPRVRDLYGYPYVSSVRMRSLPSNDGYYILGLDGTVWAFGNAKYFGSLPGAWAVDLMQAP